MKAINPATEQTIAEYTDHTPAQLEEILARSSKAFLQWRKSSFMVRGELMKRAAAGLRGGREELSRLMTSEMGKPLTASESEVDKCAVTCDFFAENAEQLLAPEAIASDASRSYVRFEPLGPVLAIMPWNFPLWQVFRFAAPNLMAGNVGLLKHAPNVPGCALAIERIFTEAGFDPGVFTTLLVSDNATAEKLAGHPVIRAVTLTGSERAGAAVSAVAGRALKKTVMELGGSDPFIVLGDADVETVAKRAAEARCINNGQSCIAAKRFIVLPAVADGFESALVAAMGQMKVGDPMDRQTRLGPLARPDILEELHRQVQQSVAQGAGLRLGGRRVPGRGYFYEPTVLSNVRPGMAVFDEETFGPVAAIIRADDEDQAVALANQSPYGLGASIWAKDASRAEALAGQIEAGNVFINGMVKSDARLPFGGIKNSGWGRELGQFGIRELVNVKTVWIA